MTSTLPTPNNQWIAVIRVRGRVNVRRDVEDTLKMLRLHKPHHCIITRYTPPIRGMLIKAQTKIAWGEITYETFEKILRARGRTVGNKRLSDEVVKTLSNGKFSGISELARAIWDGKISFRDLNWLKPVFRLHPPKGGGYKRHMKKLYQDGGGLGYWGREINRLILRML